MPQRPIALLRLLLLAVAALAGACCLAQPLVAPAGLDALRADPFVRVVDIRDAGDYAAGHVPGAVSAPYALWRGPAGNPGELPPLPALADLVQSLGLDPRVHAVVVSDGGDASDFGAAARVYWTLKVLGLPNLSILDGGMAAWSAAKLPEDRAVPSVARSDYRPRVDGRLLATRDEVVALASAGGATLVDARPAPYFAGETRHPAARAAGTLHGAVNVEHDRWFAADGSRFVAPDEARRIAGSLPLDPGKPVVAFCNTGHWAATDWFALSEVAGVPGVKLYPGSMVDATQAPKPPPMDHVPGRAKQLWIDAQLWFERTFR